MCSEKERKPHLSLWLSLLSALSTFCYGQRHRILWCSPHIAHCTHNPTPTPTLQSLTHADNVRKHQCFIRAQSYSYSGAQKPAINQNGPIKYSKQTDGFIVTFTRTAVMNTKWYHYSSLNQIIVQHISCSFEGEKSIITVVGKTNITTSVFSSVTNLPEVMTA